MLFQPLISFSDLENSSRFNTYGRSTEPDMMVVGITTTLGGSFENAGTNYLSTATHQISVNITNQGLTSGESRLRVLYKSAPGAVATEVNAGGTAVDLNPFEFQTLVFSFPIAITGPGQSFSATLESAPGEVDNSNNFATLDFDVENIESGEFLGTDIPTESFPPPRLAPGPTSYDAVVRNSGNIPVTADFEITFTSLADGTVIQHTAASTVINPGTLEYPSVAEALSITFDSSAMTGSWELSSTVTFSGIGSVVEDLDSRIVVFSQYRAEIIAAPDQSVVPGSSTMLTFLITNTGDLVDTYSISVEDTKGWASAALPPIVNLDPGASGATAIVVSVPVDEQRSNATRIFVNLTALSDGYQLSANNLVMAGDLLLAEVTASISLAVVPVQPGNMTPIPFSIENKGNSPTSFNLTSGFGSPIEGWEMELLSQKTSVLNPGENESAILQIYPPALSNPMNPAHQLIQGTQLVVWVQATASGGGVPVTGQADIEVQPVIAVDPAIESLEYILSEGESRYGETIQAIDFGIEMRHNLIDDPEDTSGATLSVGDLKFTPADGDGGQLESTRWNASITPESHSAPLVDSNGEPVFSALSVLQPSSDGLGPLAGVLEVPVTAQISDTTGIVVDTSPVTRTVSYVIPKFHSVEIDELDLQNLNPGQATTFNLSIANKGNGLANYSLQVSNSDGWIVTLSKSSYAISPEMYDWPTLSGVHKENFTMTVTAPSGTLENTVEDIIITVLDSDTGDELLVHQSPVTVGEQISAVLTPSVVNVNVSYLGDTITLLKVNNTGNTLSQFDINTTIQDGDPIEITILGSDQFILKSGRTQDLRFQVTALEGASYDTTYEINVEITSGEDISLNGTIIVQVQQWHNLEVTLPQIEVTPGENESVSYWASNFGNLIENVNVGVYLETGWNVTLEPLSHQIPIDASHAGSFVIEVPPISDENMLYNGEEFTLWFSLKNSSSGEELYNLSQTVKVRPFFALEVKDWKEEILFLPGDEKEITAVLKNSGNTDIVVNVSAKLETSQWQIIQPPQSAFTLSLGEEVLVSMKVRASGDNYYWREVGVLALNVTPVDLDVVGSGEHTANLIVERILDNNFSVYGQATTIEIPWSHVPSEQEFQASNYPASPSYILELLSSERFLNLSELQLDNESHYDWTFTLADSNDGAVALMKNVEINLKPRSKFVIDPKLNIIVNASSVEGVLPGDGYNLTLKLTHPTDQTSTIIRVIISLDNFADPFVKSITFQDSLSAIGEGESGQIVAVIRNGGTAITPYMEVELNCNDRIKLFSESTKVKQIEVMPQSTETSLIWDIDALRLEWWQTSEKVDCIVSIFSTGAEGNNIENDVLAMDASVVSWSPISQFVSVGIVMGLFIFTALLLQLGRDRDKLRQLSAYSGSALLGMIFHLSEWTLLGPILLVLVVLWLIYNAYSASDELQIIHADYQRARLGQTTLFTEHFKRLKKSRQQLTIIFTLPLLGFLMTILGFPPLLSADLLNILSLILIIGITAIIISAVLKYIDKLYGQVYSRLTLVQARLRSIERSLGDPARLLNEIANIDLEAVVEQAEGGDSDV